MEKRTFFTMEKFFELESVDVRDCKDELNLNWMEIVSYFGKLIESKAPFINPSPEEKEELISEIHEKMFSLRIVPREMLILIELNKERTAMSVKKILNILFEKDLKMAMYTLYTFSSSMAELYERKIVQFPPNCLNCEKDCFVKDPLFLHYQWGLELKQEDMECDLVHHILRKALNENQLLSAYSFASIYALIALIKGELVGLKKFSNCVFFFDKTKINELVDSVFLSFKNEIKSIFKEEEMKDFIEKAINGPIYEFMKEFEE